MLALLTTLKWTVNRGKAQCELCMLMATQPSRQIIPGHAANNHPTVWLMPGRQDTLGRNIIPPVSSLENISGRDVSSNWKSLANSDGPSRAAMLNGAKVESGRRWARKMRACLRFHREKGSCLTKTWDSSLTFGNTTAETHGLFASQGPQISTYNNQPAQRPDAGHDGL